MDFHSIESKHYVTGVRVMNEELENHMNQNADDTPEGLFANCKEKLDELEAKIHYLETEVIEKLRSEIYRFVPPTARK